MHYFVSDIHLGSGDKGEQRRVERLFLDFLSKIEADAESLDDFLKKMPLDETKD